MRRQRDLYELLAQCNQTIVRGDSEERLFSETLGHAVARGKFLFAWLARLLDDGTLEPVVVAGEDMGFVQRLRLETDSATVTHGDNPMGRALRSGRTAISNDFLADAGTARWHDDARRVGIRASAAVPIHRAGAIWGALGLYAAEAGYFDTDVVLAIETMAADISFGLDSLATRAALRDANRLLESRVEERTRELSIAKAQAEAADRAKTVFLSSVSHELRSPLHSIIGYTSLLNEGLSGPLTEPQRRQLTIVQEASAHLLAIINDLLDITRIESGKVVITISRFDLGAVMRRLTERFTLVSQRQQVPLEVEFPTDGLEVESDERRVEQILGNLLDNAFKYTPEGRVRLWSECVAGGVTMYVSDTGPGIAPADQQRIFGRFTQLERPDGVLAEGAGLGLAIAAGLAAALGGRVAVSSEPGAGSVFSLVLPDAAMTAGA